MRAARSITLLLITTLAATAANAAAQGPDIGARLVSQLRKSAGGVHMMGIGWENRIPPILEPAGKRPLQFTADAVGAIVHVPAERARFGRRVHGHSR